MWGEVDVKIAEKMVRINHWFLFYIYTSTLYGIHTDVELLISFFKAKFIAQIIILGGQVIGRAFAQALKQEFRSK